MRRQCTTPDCTGNVVGHGLCGKHYVKALRAGAFTDAKCETADCTAPVYAKQLCSKHYQRARKYGDPTTVLCIQGDNEARFWSNVNKTDDCWRWTGAPDVYGYGRMRVGARQVKAHRYAYELLIGPIPEGLTIDHLCRVRHCVNPAHLEPVSNAENARRAQEVRA